MASQKSHFFLATVRLGLLLAICTLDFSVAQTGVCYGTLGTGLPSPSDVVALYNRNNIRRMRIYNPDQQILQALAGSNIELILGVPNDRLQDLASSQASADAWVQANVRNHPNVRFRYIAVGNEVSPLRGDTSQYVGFVLPAMRNVQNAISAAGLGQIRVSTAIETGVVTNSYPPADGVFRGEVRSYLDPIVAFLVQNQAPLLVNVYPYFAHVDNPRDVSLAYALFTSDGVVVPGGIRYQNVFYAIVDSVYASLEKVGGSSVEIVVSESGWPSTGGFAATTENARIYNTNLIQRVKNGTPKRPGRAIETYIFAMFNEDQKNPEFEKHFGIFLRSQQPKYPISFS